MKHAEYCSRLLMAAPAVLVALSLLWIQPLRSQQNYMADAALASLQKEAKPLIEHTAPTFIAEYKDLNITCTALYYLMFYPGEVSKVCLVLSGTTWGLQKGFQGVSHLPYVGKPAEVAATSLGGLKKSLDAWKKKMDEISKETTPRGRAIKALLITITTSSTLAFGLEKGLPGYIEAQKKAIEDKKKLGMKPGDIRDQRLAKDIDNDAMNVRNLNAAYSLLIPPAQNVNKSAKADIVPAFDSIKEFNDNLQPYEDKLSPLRHALNQIEHVLGKKISHGFKYPHPSWKHPFRTSTYHIRISVKDALEGFGHVEHIIKDHLSHFLYKALKAFGLDKFVKEFLSSGESIAKRELEKIAIKAVDEIPGASTIMSEASKAEDSLENLDQLSNIDFTNANHFAQLITNSMKAAQ